MAFDINTAKPVASKFDIKTARPIEENTSSGYSIAGPISRGVEAIQKGIKLGDAPSIIGKMVNSAGGGIPKFLMNRPIAGPIQGIRPSGDFMPKPVTPEGDKLGNEMGFAASFLPSVEILQGIVAPVARGVAKGASNRLMNSVLKPTIKQLEREPLLGLKAAKLGLSGTKEQIAVKALKLIEKNESKIDSIIANGKGRIDAVKIADVMDEIKRPFANTGDDASVMAIEKVQETLRNKGTLSVQEAQQLKKDFYSGLTNAYGPGSGKLSAGIKAEKGAASGLKKGIEKLFPGTPIADINRETGIAGTVRKAATRQDLMGSRNNLLGLVDAGLAATTLASEDPKYLGAAIARRTLGSDIVKSKLAELLAKFV
jgi:hypothetical protein